MGDGAVFFGRQLLEIYSSDRMSLAMALQQPSDYLWNVFSVRNHGYDGRSTPRNRLLRHSDVCLSNGRVPVPCDLDLHGLCGTSDTWDALSLISGILDHYIQCSCDLLFADSPEYGKKRTESEQNRQ